MDKPIPTHVSIIMDGNGRWAKARGLERVAGHMEGIKSVRACIEAASQCGVKYLSLYAFSEENWNRPQEEVSALMSLMMKQISEEAYQLLENHIRLLVLGNRERLSEPMNQAISDLEARTARDFGSTLIIFLSYSGQWDILQAMKKAAAQLTPEQFQALDAEGFEQYLVTAGIPAPDLLIRTSGEFRISNYLLWQTAYTEFYFTDVLWPDFREEQFRLAVEAFAARDRRYGKVK